jgi:hypothetical protein
VKHVRRISLEGRVGTVVRADAKADYIDTLYRSTVDFVYAKMTETPTGSDTTTTT